MIAFLFPLYEGDEETWFEYAITRIDPHIRLREIFPNGPVPKKWEEIRVTWYSFHSTLLVNVNNLHGQTLLKHWEPNELDIKHQLINQLTEHHRPFCYMVHKAMLHFKKIMSHFALTRFRLCSRPEILLNEKEWLLWIPKTR